MKRWLFAAVLGLLLALSATAVFASHSWGSYHWARTSNPFTLSIVDSMTSDWDGYLTLVSSDPNNNDWSDSSVLDTQIEAGDSSNGTRKKCSAISGKIRACNANYGGVRWIGLAQIWVYSDGHIAKATAKMNDYYFSQPFYNDPVAKRHVLCQEIGHDFGLGHQPAGSVSCMNDTYDAVGGVFDPNAQYPNAHDYDQLALIYSHLDTKSTIAASTASSANGDGSDHPDFGTPVGPTDGKGRPNLFVRDLAFGNKLFTWVFWVD